MGLTLVELRLGLVKLGLRPGLRKGWGWRMNGRVNGDGNTWTHEVGAGLQAGWWVVLVLQLRLGLGFVLRLRLRLRLGVRNVLWVWKR